MEFGIFVMTCAFGGMFLWGMGWRVRANMYRRLYERAELLNAKCSVQDSTLSE